MYLKQTTNMSKEEKKKTNVACFLDQKRHRPIGGDQNHFQNEVNWRKEKERSSKKVVVVIFLILNSSRLQWI